MALVACGKAHTVVYTRSGKLFSFGSNAEGQLGVGRAPEYSDIPMELSAAKEVIREEVAKLAAGSVHSLALGRKTGESPTAFNARAKSECLSSSPPGQIYVWGTNTDGQLGLGPDTEEMIFSPALLKLPSTFDSSTYITDIRFAAFNFSFVNYASASIITD